MSPTVKSRARRQRRTRPSVRRIDALARTLITVGGIGTIAAVATLCLFLGWVVVPLFLPERLEERTRIGALAEDTAHTPLAVGVDEYVTLGWALDPTGEVRGFELADGRGFAREELLLGLRPSALSARPTEGAFTAGFEDGTLRLGTVGFGTRFLESGEITPELERLARGERQRFGAGTVERTTGDQLRLQELAVHLGDPLDIGARAALLRVDHVDGPGGSTLAALSVDGVLHVSRAIRKKNLLTDEETLALTRGTAELEFPVSVGSPRWLFVLGLGENVLLLWEDGSAWRCDARDLEAVRVVEKTHLVVGEDARVTAATLMIGRNTLVLGDSRGRLHAWFRVKPADAGTPDGIVLAHAHTLGEPGAAVCSLAPSARGRLLAAGRDDGSLSLFQVTRARELLSARLPGATGPLSFLALAPKDDALLAGDAHGTALWSVRAPHHEVGAAVLFAPVWYEGYPGPEYVWQSSSGTDDFEPKYGLLPLVFGTIKATFYSLIFGVPIALLAAVYTSEFLHPRLRARVKPAIEMMASLPSVVLGFLAALVIAPLVEDVVPGVLTAVVAVPFTIVLGGHVWRALPQSRMLGLERWRLGFVGLCAGLGVLVAGLAGPWIERLFFAGDMRQWLTGSVGDAVGGWMILVLPAVAVAVAWAVTCHLGPRLIAGLREAPATRFARWSLLGFLLASALVVALTWLVAVALDSAGLDPRGGVLDTYVQRNALVVGFVMGFAIIPIVYTIAEDALASVPDHLRAASLGAGATPWQTAMRVVLPTAMSGIFSAVMIGFGRAVGETMIVLMAAGNTPVMDWNVFNGFRTLSANIAVELPEAVRNSTHYRTLFLAALVLFAMTFALNTAAELVRLRYRKRSVQL